MLPMLNQKDMCYDEVFGLMKLSYLHCHIMLSSSEGTYIRIGPLLATQNAILIYLHKLIIIVLQNGELQNKLKPIMSSTTSTLSCFARSCHRVKGLTSSNYFLGIFQTWRKLLKLEKKEDLVVIMATLVCGSYELIEHRCKT